jgi:S-formylglutathione hydrolase
MRRMLICCFVYAMWSSCGDGSELLLDQRLSVGDLGAEPVTYDILLPDGHDASQADLPLLLFLHGGGEGGHVFLRSSRPWIDELWKSGELPPMVIATPHVGPMCFYLDYRDGTQKWESIVVGPFLETIRSTYGVSSAPDKTLMMGISMGGAGTLSIGLRRPGHFRALVAIEPAIQPALKWLEADREMFFWFNEERWRERYGSPVDEAFWEANNPASIAVANAAKIRNSGVKIFLECGDQDYLNLHRGAEFLHRILWDHGIEHEYRSYHGADHIGESLKPRIQAGLRFLTTVLREPAPEPEVQQWREDMDYWRAHGRPRAPE